MGGQGSPQPAYQLLQPLARGQAAAGGDGATQSDISKAISGLNEIVKQTCSLGGGDWLDVLWNVWNAVFDMAAEVPLQQQDDALVNFMRDLQRTTVAGPDGTAIKAGDFKVWDEIPHFGWVARDIWNFSPNDPDATEEKQAKFNNQTAFLARLTARADVVAAGPKHPFDYSMYALWSMRDAFEEARDSTPAIKNAAVWFRHIAKKLRDLSLAGHAFPQNSGRPGALYVEKGWKGFSQDRWTVWKSGFETALSEQKIDAETRELIKTGMGLL